MLQNLNGCRKNHSYFSLSLVMLNMNQDRSLLASILSGMVNTEAVTIYATDLLDNTPKK